VKQHFGKLKASTVLAAVVVTAMFVAMPLATVKIAAFDGREPDWWLAWPLYGAEAFVLVFFGLLYWFSQSLHKQAHNKLGAVLSQLRAPHMEELIEITPGGRIFTFIVAQDHLQCINVWLSDGEPVFAAKGLLAKARAIDAWQAVGLKVKTAKVAA